MTQEQKAKAYDKAVQEAYIAYKDEDKHLKATLERIFPELKESEDERMWKLIKKYVHYNISDIALNADHITREQLESWLEKQGEPKYTKKNIDDAYLEGISVAKNEMEKQYEADYQIRKDIATFIFNYRGDLKDRAKWMDYLGIKLSFIKEKQKPNKKIEPKFHEGDFIVNDYCMGKVIEVTNDDYLLDTGQGIPFSCEHNAHLWTIKDAKEGDVLFHSDSASNGIFIFKEILQRGNLQKVICYCDYDSEDGFCLGKNHTCCWSDSKYIKPATKEQRDLLFQKMAEAGYEWDTEKKELKNIEDEPENYKQQVMSEITDLVEDYTKQKSIKWNEDDSAKLQACIDSLQAKSLMGKVDTVLTNWLKSLKERIGG